VSALIFRATAGPADYGSETARIARVGGR